MYRCMSDSYMARLSILLARAQGCSINKQYSSEPRTLNLEFCSRNRMIEFVSHIQRLAASYQEPSCPAIDASSERVLSDRTVRYIISVGQHWQLHHDDRIS